MYNRTTLGSSNKILAETKGSAILACFTTYESTTLLPTHPQFHNGAPFAVINICSTLYFRWNPEGVFVKGSRSERTSLSNEGGAQKAGEEGMAEGA